MNGLPQKMEMYTFAAINLTKTEIREAERREGEDDIAYFERLIGFVPNDSKAALKTVLQRELDEEKQRISKEMLDLQFIGNSSTGVTSSLSRFVSGCILFFLAMLLVHDLPKPISLWGIAFIVAFLLGGAFIFLSVIFSETGKEKDEYEKEKDEEEKEKSKEIKQLEEELLKMRRIECERYQRAVDSIC